MVVTCPKTFPAARASFSSHPPPPDKPTRVLVTGGAGYVGSRLVPYLIDHGMQVDVLDKLVFGADGLAACRGRPGFGKLVVKDIRAVDISDLSGYDAIVHLAGLSNDPTAEYNVEANLAINVGGSIKIVDAAYGARVPRFVFASSCSIYYSMNPDESMRDEEFNVDPKAPYSMSKYRAEQYILNTATSLDAKHPFSPVCLRKGTIFGQSPRMRYDLVANVMTKDAFNRRTITVHNGGRAWRPMLSMADACHAYLLALTAPRERVHGKVINVLSRNIRVLDLAREVRRRLEGDHGCKIDLNVQEAGATRSYKVDWARAQECLGFEPDPLALSSEVSDMWEALESGCEYDRPIYYNLRWLELLEDMKGRLEKMGGGAL